MKHIDLQVADLPQRVRLDYWPEDEYFLAERITRDPGPEPDPGMDAGLRVEGVTFRRRLKPDAWGGVDNPDHWYLPDDFVVYDGPLHPEDPYREGEK